MAGRAGRDAAPEGSWDYIVVGGGTAGCVVASRLSESGGARVLLLEAGRDDRSMFLRVPGATRWISSRYHWSYMGEPDPTRGMAVQKWLTGKAIGGGSSVNGMIWCHGHPADYDRWAELGATGWNAQVMDDIYRDLETVEGGGDPRRGRAGPQHVSYSRCAHPATDMFLAAAQKAGWPLVDDYNSGRALGVSPAQLSQGKGWRASTARGYLAKARRRPNLTVRPGASVRRVVFDGQRAAGVEYQDRTGVHQASAGREVVLCAGTLISPKLLMLSGIGPGDELLAQGISVVADSPEVGRNLQDHVYSTFIHEVSVPTLNREISPLAMVRHGLRYALTGRGPASSGAAHAVAFLSLSDETPWPDVQVTFAPFAFVAEVDGKDGPVHDAHKIKALPVPGTTTMTCLLHPRTAGRVRLRSSDPGDEPSLTFEAFTEAGDVELLRKACEAVRRVFASEPLASTVVRENLAGPDVSGEDGWRDYLRARSWNGYHAVGTCRMGSDPSSVVDPELRVRGVEGLRVVDASVMPTLPSGNTNAPVVAIAERAARFIRAAG